MTPPSLPVALGLDYGRERVGLAAVDPSGTMAFPVATLSRRDSGRLWQRVRDEAHRRRATVIVIGLPRTLRGTEGEAAIDARAFAAEAAAATGLVVELWDERLSTRQAERLLREAGAGPRRRRERVDAVAAAVTLQAWLEAQRHSLAAASPPAPRRT